MGLATEEKPVPEEAAEERFDSVMYMPLCMCMGAGLGSGFGLALGNISMGISAGAALGALLGAAMYGLMRYRNKD